LRISRSFLERNLYRFTQVLQDTVFAEEIASRKGWLQQMDTRVKLFGCLLMVLSSSFSHRLSIVTAIYIMSVALSFGSGLFSISFLRRVWVFMPFYTALIALPALFLTPGKPIPVLGMITEQGLRSAAFLVMRVATSVSFMFLLVLTTSWPQLMKALRTLGFPRVMVFLLAMTYRYIYVLLSTANALFLARKSRKIGPEAWQTSRRWIGAILATLLGKSYQLSQDVYLAMQSRGFRGEPVLLSDFRLRLSDAAWLFLFLLCGAFALYFGYWSTF
jgi:cobalt ECF transporter T component CbiQ